MTGFAFTLLMVTLFLLGTSVLMHVLMARGHAREARIITAHLARYLGGIFLFYLFINNYCLAATALQRFIGKELLTLQGGVLANIAIGGVQLQANQLLAALVVVFSFVGVSWWLSSLKRLAMVMEARGRQEDGGSYFIAVIAVIGATLCALSMLLLDVLILVIRTAMMLWPDELAGSAGDLPSIFHLLHRHAGTMGALFLAVVMVTYPLMIILAEKTWLSAKGTLEELLQPEAVPAPPLPAELQPEAPPHPRRRARNEFRGAPGGAAIPVERIPFADPPE